MLKLKKAAQRALDCVTNHGGGVNILVVGDLILDRFLYGSVERISPEAPVPVVDVEREVSRPGGATNVVFNLLSMGARVSVAGVVGEDAAAAELRGLVASEGAELSGIVGDYSRPTAVKTRVIAQHQQMVRFDRESSAPLSLEVLEGLRDRISSLSSSASWVIVSDYGKAVIREETINAVRESGLPFAVDPKPQNAALYSGATVITPNTRETELLSGIRPTTDGAARAAGMAIIGKLGVRSVLVTRGEKGMSLVPGSGEPVHIPTRARDVFDVTGAGDTSISIYSLAMACGAAPLEAACLANLAAGIVVGKLGTATVTVPELAAALDDWLP